MFITNPRSNLTPSQEGKSGIAKSKYNVLSKQEYQRNNLMGGYKEHSCSVPSSMPYVSVRNVF